MSNAKKPKEPNVYKIDFPIVAPEPGVDSIYLKRFQIELTTKAAETKKKALQIAHAYEGPSKRNDDIIRHYRFMCIKAGENAKKIYPGIGPMSEVFLSVDSSGGRMETAVILDPVSGESIEVIHWSQIQGAIPSPMSEEQIEKVNKAVKELQKANSSIAREI